MTYSQYGKIEATDFNTFAGNASVASTTANAINTVWGIGTGKFGYGQTPVPNVAAGQAVAATNWDALLTVALSSSRQQNTTITAITVPTTGTTISHLSVLASNLAAIYGSKNNASGQGTTTPNTYVHPTAWSNQLTVTHACTFESADKARYFFNCGGQLSLTFSHPTGTGINSLISTMAASCGTITISSPDSGTVSIAGTSFAGVSKVGGSGTPLTLLPNVGYYGLTTTNQEIFKQLATTGSPSGYVESFISVSARSNGASGSNGDNGSIIYITTVWDEVPNGLLISAGTTTTLNVRYPATSYLTNSWGTVSVIASATGS